MAALRGLLAALGTLTALAPPAASADAPRVDRTGLDGEIISVTSAYLGSAVDRPADDHADALPVVINTPGGLSDAMDSIVTGLLNSPVPVLSYVSAPGARAASAGLFAARSADLRAMAPGTDIGSVHPVAAAPTPPAISAGKCSTTRWHGCTRCAPRTGAMPSGASRPCAKV